jgi:hypothetical protein
MVDKRDEADKLIDEMIVGKTPEEIVGEGGLPVRRGQTALWVRSCRLRRWSGRRRF